MTLAALLVPALRWDAGHGYAHLTGAIDQALRAGVGGFLLVGGPGAAAAELAAELHHRSRVPLLLAANAERGAGQQFDGCVALPPLRALGVLDDPPGMRRAGQVTARDLRRIGLNWALAPVCDLDSDPGNATVGTRAAGADPERVGALIAEWIDGCQSEGVLACAKHFPGLGHATAGPAAALPTVTIGARWLEEDALAPFRSAVDAGVASVMIAHAAYPALDASGDPATQSGPIVDGMLRGAMEFDGLVVSHAPGMRAAHGAEPAPESAVRAVAAGCDLLLAPGDLPGTAQALDRAAQRGELTGGRVRDALERRERWARWARPGAGREPSLDDEIWSRQVADAAVTLVRGAMPRVGDAVEIVQVGAAGGPWPASGRAHFVEALGALEIEANVIDLRSDGTRVPVLVAVFGDAGAEGEGPEGGLSSAARDRIERAVAIAAGQRRDSLVVLFAHPRCAAQVEAAPNVLCAWGGERPMQAAAARVIARTSQ